MTARGPRDEERAPALVVDDRLRPRVVERGIANLVPEEMRVEVLEDSDLALAPELVLDRDLFEVDVPVKVDSVAAAKAQPERRVVQRRVAHERLVLVGDVDLPVVAADPAEPAVGPDTEAARRADGVVLLPDMRVVDVAELIAPVEGDEEIAIAQR